MRKLAIILSALLLFLGACTDDDGVSAGDDAAQNDDTDDGTSNGDNDDPSGDDGSTDDSGDDDADDSDDSDDGDDDSDGDDDPDDGDDDAPASSGNPDDKAALDAALATVQADAEGRGYSVTTEPASDDDEEDDLEFESAECAEAQEAFDDLEEQIEAGAESDTLTASSGEFESPDSVVEEVTVDLGSSGSADVISGALGSIRSVDFGTCLAEAFEAEAEDDDVTLEDLEVSTVDGDLGDDEVRVTISGTFTTQGFSFPMHIVFSIVQVDRHAVAFSTFTINDEVSDDALAILATAVDALP